MKIALNRVCGECQSCCTVKGIVELNKTPGIPCTHLTELGCGIYQDRPRSCELYKCHWLRGLIDDKPSESGFIIDIDREVSTLEFMYCAWEAWPGAFKDQSVLFRIKKLCKKLDNPIVVNSLGVFSTLKWRETLFQRFGKDLTVTWI